MQFVDLKKQYLNIKEEVDAKIQEVLNSTAFINGKQVSEFADNLAAFTGAKHVIPCANGTDALQIALMSLDLEPGAEIIVPAFTYVATAEVIGLLKLTPVLVDVCPLTFNTTAENIANAITPRTRAIVPVHLFGQSCNMEPILELATKHNLYVIEDNAQAIGAEYTFSNGHKVQTGVMGHIGCTSFFPSKNLGCYGDGGAIFTNSDTLATKLKMIANHGQKIKYHHSVIGCNSRLDTIQAAILNIKLKHLKEYSAARYTAAQQYTSLLSGITGIETPFQAPYTTHVYHQYTLKINEALSAPPVDQTLDPTNKRASLQKYLSDNSIPTMVYYPLPLHHQEAFKHISIIGENLHNSQTLCKQVLSLPMHTELTTAEIEYVCEKLHNY